MRFLFIPIFLFCTQFAYAEDPCIWLPNLPGCATGTNQGGGHFALDVNASITPTGTQDINLIEVGGAPIALGQTTMSASLPVVISSNQSAVPASQSGTWNINNISGTVSLPTGASTSAKQPALGTAGTASADVITVQGIASMTPLIVTTTGSTSAVNLTQVGGAAIALGQTTMSASIPIAIASNQTALPVSQNGTWTVQPGNTPNTTPWLETISQGGNSATVTASNALKVDGSAVTQPVSMSGASAPINPAGSFAQITNLTTTAQTLTKPSNAVGFVLEASSTNVANVRYSIGSAATTTSGIRLEPGRDSGYMPVAANVSVITETGSTQEVDIQWVLNQ